MKKGINREILRYVGEILIAVLFAIVSYNGLVKSRLSSFAETAASYDKANYDLQATLVNNNNSVLESENVLADTVLSVRNPNSNVVTARVNLKVSKNAQLDRIDIEVNGKELNLDNMVVEDNYYVIPVEKYEMSAYEDKAYQTKIYGNPYYTTSFDFTYDVTESFYN